MPPFARSWLMKSAFAWERTGAALSAPLAGVHIVEATKQVYRAIPARRERSQFAPALNPALAPSPRVEVPRVGGMSRIGETPTR